MSHVHSAKEIRVFDTVRHQQQNRDFPEVCLVIPAYNEQSCVDQAVEVLGTFLSEHIQKGHLADSSHILFVDDGSTDATWSMIIECAEATPLVQGIKLTRNYGHQHALLAGLHFAESDVVISLDADLQDDVTVMDRMLNEYREGAEIVYGVRSNRDQDTLFKKLTAETYYKLMRLLGVELVYNHADFRLLSAKALHLLCSYEEVNLFLRGMIPTLGLKHTTVEYVRQPRSSGKSKYPFRAMLRLAFTGITSLSPAPLRFISLLGILVSLLSVVLLGWTVYTKLTNPAAVPGWASSVVPIYFLGGAQLFALGVVGEYISRIYLETKRRPRFLIDTVVGISRDAS